MSSSTQTKISWPGWSRALLKQERYYRFIDIYGGRGSTKSWTVARWLINCANSQFERILCTREIQRTIKQSVHKLIVDQIAAMGVGHQFVVTDNEIRHPATGSEFIFAGLRANVDQIKSLEGVTKCWVEEAETVTEASWRTLIPTIRQAGSQIVLTFNPRDEEDATWQLTLKLMERARRLNDCLVLKVNHGDNPWFKQSPLHQDMLDDYAADEDVARHVWEGEFRKNSEAQIMRGRYVVREFEPRPEWGGPYFGLDYGFSNDPTSCHTYWLEAIDGDERKLRLYVEHETYAHRLELKDTKRELGLQPAISWTVPESRDVQDQVVPAFQQYTDRLIYADSARPESTSFLRGEGLNVQSVEKWPGSIEDGIGWLKSLAGGIVIHPRCEAAIKEARLYSYKVDKVTGKVTRQIVDRWNNFWDDCRYAMSPFIKARMQQMRVEYDATGQYQQQGGGIDDREVDEFFPQFATGSFR